MTSQNDVTSRRSTILSADDPRIDKLEYTSGDKFLFKPKTYLKREEYDQDIRFEEDGQTPVERIIVEITGYMLFAEGDIGYCFNFIEPQREYVWALRSEEVQEDFVYLGGNFEEARFVFIND